MGDDSDILCVLDGFLRGTQLPRNKSRCECVCVEETILECVCAMEHMSKVIKCRHCSSVKIKLKPG